MRKTALVGLMSGLTASTAFACKWQYERYQDSVTRWRKLSDQLHKQTVPTHRVDELPISSINADNFQHFLLFATGILNPKIVLINRYKQARSGSLFMSCLSENDEGYAVNLGWVPTDKIEETIQLLKDQGEKEIQIKCMVKIQEAKSNNPKQDSDQESFIDLESISKEFNLKNQTSKYFYLDKIGEEDRDLQLYPVPNYLSTFEHSDMKPEKHKVYYMFYGTCSTICLMTLLRLVIIMK